jgi:hypothetical protein
VLNCETALFALEHVDEYARQAAIIRSEREQLLSSCASCRASRRSRARPT